jgi:hypothetical protein
MIDKAQHNQNYLNTTKTNLKSSSAFSSSAGFNPIVRKRRERNILVRKVCWSVAVSVCGSSLAVLERQIEGAEDDRKNAGEPP